MVTEGPPRQKNPARPKTKQELILEELESTRNYLSTRRAALIEDEEHLELMEKEAPAMIESLEQTIQEGAQFTDPQQRKVIDAHIEEAKKAVETFVQSNEELREAIKAAHEALDELESKYEELEAVWKKTLS